MISLKASILANTNIGAEKIIGEVKEWLYNTRDVVEFTNYIQDIDVTIDRTCLYKINILSKESGRKILYNHFNGQFNIGDKDCNNGNIYRKIYEICLDGTPLDIVYKCLIFNSSDEFVKNCNNKIFLYACYVDIIDSLPKFCKELYFSVVHIPGVRRIDCMVEKIKNLKLKKFEVLNEYALNCNIYNINNNTIDTMVIWDSMLNCEECVLNERPRVFTLSEEAAEKLKLLMKNNNIKELFLKFYKNRNEMMKKVQIKNGDVVLI